jgi:acyl-CoA synthetase (NDP forming)
LDILSPLDRLIRPRSVAIIGASADPTKTAGRPLKYLKRHGFTGDIYPINPRYEDLDGTRCYPDVASLPGVPDAAIILVGADRAESYVRDLSQLGTAATIILAGGYAEVDEEGQARQRALRAAAGTMRILGPNTVGVVNVVDRVTLSASGALDVEGLRAGGIALVSQSGGILGSVLSRAAFRGAALSRLIATGNEADLEICDFIDYLIADPETSVIALYIEGLRNSGRFRRAALAAAQAGKALVVYKVGRSEAGARSTASHTGALAGEDRLYDALFAQVGAIRADRFSDFIDIAIALSIKQRMPGKRLAILTTTGGAGALVADACGLLGYDTPAPSPTVTSELGALLSSDGFSADRNPIDLTLAGLQPRILKGAISTLTQSPEFDAVITVVGSSSVGQPELVAKPLVEILALIDKPMVAYVSPSAPDILRHLNASGVPAFENPEGVAAAIDALYRTGQYKVADEIDSIAVLPATNLPASGFLNEAESKELFASYGIPGVKEIVAKTPEAAAKAALKLGSRVVLKILSRAIAHKSDVGGVRVGIPATSVLEECHRMQVAVAAKTDAAIEGFLVQEMAGDGVEVILGFVRDPQLGPAILLGGGGIAAEIYKDTAIRLAPLTAADVADMIDELAVARLLRGYRGKPACDIAALSDAVLAFSRMCLALGDHLKEAEINPLFVLPSGQGVCAADGLVVLHKPKKI